MDWFKLAVKTEKVDTQTINCDTNPIQIKNFKYNFQNKNDRWLFEFQEKLNV